MATFLGVPREIRDTIYYFVLLSEISPPISALAAQRERASSETKDHIFRMLTHLPVGPLPILSYGLLSTCRQIRAETRDAIVRLNNGACPRYKIDGVFDHKYSSYWTWISVPYFSRHVDTVDVDIRFFGAVSVEELEDQCDECRPHRITMQLLTLLELFLERGPHLLAPETSSRMRVRVVNVNIISTDGIPALKMISAERRDTYDFRKLPSPETVGDDINEDLYFASRSVNFFGFVDHIKVFVDGRLKQDWDFTIKDWWEKRLPTPRGCWAD